MNRQWNRRTFVHCLVAMAASIVLPAGIARAQTDVKPGQTPLRVLFIGNSYTGFNDLPGMVEQLATAARGRPVEAKKHVHGGWTFQRHMDDPNEAAANAIKDGPWDFVVLQEQSQLPYQYPHVTHEHGLRMGALVKSHKATPMLFMTWARQHMPEKQALIAQTYQKLAAALEAPCAPVGLAWEAALKQRPDFALHAGDKSHPAPAGTYLAACVFYATLFDRSPEGLPGNLFRDKERTRALVELKVEDAKFLQGVAWETVKRAKVDAPRK